MPVTFHLYNNTAYVAAILVAPIPFTYFLGNIMAHKLLSK